MAKSEVAIFTPDDLNVVATERALHAYKFAYQYAGIELDEETEVDFIATRNLLSGWKELDELRKIALYMDGKTVKDGVRFCLWTDAPSTS